MTASTPKIFDGHNDTLLKLVMHRGTKKERSFFERVDYDHIDLPRAKEGNLCGGFFALWVPSQRDLKADMGTAHDDPSNFSSVPQESALAYTGQLISQAVQIERAAKGEVILCRSTREIRETAAQDKFAILLHMEGAEAIDPDFAALDMLYEAGLRSIGPVWSRQNIFADGVPMRFNSSPDTGSGLTEKGRELVRRCNHMGVMLDMSHITEKGFWDVAALSTKPLVATHSNVHAICPHARNLTDKQLAAIAESKGVVGINFAVSFLREDGSWSADTPLDLVVRHAAYLVEKLGEDGVALGSDFDGCRVPKDLKDASGLPCLIEALRTAGFGEELIEKIAHKNWWSVLERTGI
ncbi:dipeptidase [Pseudovibrio exalbescens]|uniref:dipeptidase n=1 Tax=Pseudovibrio exalbescens TaxID=197461 RepID=UPI0023666CF1|nr:dipeptidase [Pseudovibrio exalbescens]MDD7909235.1 dipeptidase [Pseudovibrio exalbescens]